MNRYRFASKLFGAAIVGLGVGCATPAQSVPVLPGPLTPPAPAPLAPNMLGVAPGGGPPGPVTFWQKMGVGQQQMEACRRKLCNSPAGMLMGRAIAPMSKLSGGLIPPFCPVVPTAGELLDPGAIGASSKAKMDKLNAEKRKKAVEELAGLDCHYWPEAEDALIGALRADRNECVRHTAAIALQRGCCCTKKTIAALEICVSGSEADGHPCEKSPRVRAAAAIALEMCLQRACCPTCPIPEGAIPVPVEVKPLEEKPKGEEPKESDKTKDSKTSAISWVKPGPESDDVDPDVAARKQAKAYYEKVKKTKTTEQLLAKAKQTLETMPPLPLDLSIPTNHPDYIAAGVNVAAIASADRPANLLDMLSGVNPTATARYDASPVIARPTTAVATAEPVRAPVETKPVAVPPAMAMPATTTVKKSPAQMIDLTVPVSPLAMPVTAPAPKPVEIVVPKPMPANTISNASKVLKMLETPSDLAILRASIEELTPADLKDQNKLTTALLKAAEYPSDTGLRVACLKAVSRSPEKPAEMKASLEKIARDRDTAVASQAAKTLQSIR